MMGDQRYQGLVLAGIVILAGCSVPLLGPSASVSDPRVRMVEDVGPVLVFNYSVDDYSDVLLEAPNGRVINEGTLEPEKKADALAMGMPTGGEYTLIIQQGGETVVTESITFDGPDPSVSDFNTEWSENHLSKIGVRVENSGDLPVLITGVRYSAQGQSASGFGIYRWVHPGTSERLTIESSFGDEIVVSEPGVVTVDVQVNTSDGLLSATSQREFEPPQFEVSSVSPTWDNGGLRRIDFTVQNTGELPGSFTATSFVNGEQLLVGEATLGPGESDDYYHRSASAFSDPLYQVTEGGEYTVTMRIESQYGSTEASATKRFEGLDISISDVSTSSYANYGSDTYDLWSISYMIRNTGDIRLTYDSVRISINGVSRLQSPIVATDLAPGEATTEYLTFSDSITLEAGKYDLTLSYISEGEVIAEATVSVTIS